MGVTIDEIEASFCALAHQTEKHFDQNVFIQMAVTRQTASTLFVSDRGVIYR
jgi:hypothetical protein